MNIGMLWFDNDPKTKLAEKIARAIKFYQDKYGFEANLVYVHPSMLDENTPECEVRVEASRSILPHHIWVGMDAHAA